LPRGFLSGKRLPNLAMALRVTGSMSARLRGGISDPMACRPLVRLHVCQFVYLAICPPLPVAG